MIKFYLKETLRSIRNARGTFLFSTIVLALSIVLLQFSAFLVLASGKLDNYMKSRISVEIFLKDDISQKDVSEFKKSVESNPLVKSVKHITSEKALEEFKESFSYNLIEMLGENPLPQSLILKFKPEKFNFDEINLYATELKSNSIVDEVVIDKNLISEIIFALKSVQGFVFFITFVFILFTFITQYLVNHLIIKSREDIMQIMKYVGAKNSSIYIPVYLRSLLMLLISILIIVPMFKITTFLIGPNSYLTPKIEVLFYLSTVISGFILSFLSASIILKKIRLT